jgi:DNA mismatch endonuclease (patch repair protein)
VKPPIDPPVDPSRSRLMGRVAQRDTKPEMIVRKALFAGGYRYRLHGRRLPGTPDLVFPGRRAAVFVHGCFWHRHSGCPSASMPKTRAEFWSAKFATNVARDRRVEEELRASGWRVHVVWECETRGNRFLEPLLNFLNYCATLNERGKGA